MTPPYSRHTVGMRFSSVLKGRLAERILVTLLERGGFRVTRLGVEEVFDEIKYLSKENYLALGLPERLRYLPDLLIASPAVTWAALVEVKYRRRFDRESAQELRATLTKQRAHWAESYAVVMISESTGRFHQDYIRVIPPQKTDLLVSEIPPLQGETDDQRWMRVWDQLPMLTTLFYEAPTKADPAAVSRFQEFWRNADYITEAIRQLGSAG